MPENSNVETIPKNHALNVLTGKSGSSTGGTIALTSAYGL